MGHHCVNSRLRRAFNVVVGDEVVGSGSGEDLYVKTFESMPVPKESALKVRVM